MFEIEGRELEGEWRTRIIQAAMIAASRGVGIYPEQDFGEVRVVFDAKVIDVRFMRHQQLEYRVRIGMEVMEANGFPIGL